jgi:hypothetical protein
MTALEAFDAHGFVDEDAEAFGEAVVGRISLYCRAGVGKLWA